MGRDKVPRPSAKKGKKEAAKAAAKGKAAGGEEDADLMLDPLCIRFTHAKIRSTFSGCGRTIEQTMQEIRDGKITPLDLPRITVIPLEDGKTYCSLNNRRLYVFRWARGDGLIPGNKVGVRIKHMETTTRHAAKYSLERCSDKARFMREPGDKTAGLGDKTVGPGDKSVGEASRAPPSTNDSTNIHSTDTHSTDIHTTDTHEHTTDTHSTDTFSTDTFSTVTHEHNTDTHSTDTLSTDIHPTDAHSTTQTHINTTPHALQPTTQRNHAHTEPHHPICAQSIDITSEVVITSKIVITSEVADTTTTTPESITTQTAMMEATTISPAATMITPTPPPTTTTTTTTPTTTPMTMTTTKTIPEM